MSHITINGASQQVEDTNGNELLKFSETASAVNELTLANSATGSGPSLAATGGDTNIDATLKGKGTGKVILGQATSTGVQFAADQALLDSSANELVKFTKASSAVNELTVANAATGSAPSVSASGGDTDINLTLTPKGAGFVNVSAGGFQARGTAAVTATTGGGTTGLIPAGASFVVVTSDSADKQISLPAASVGDRIRILVGATGCELISVTAADKVNDVTVGATNEAALTAENLYDCQYVATNTWVVIGYTKLGAVQAALVPDTL